MAKRITKWIADDGSEHVSKTAAEAHDKFEEAKANFPKIQVEVDPFLESNAGEVDYFIAVLEKHGTEHVKVIVDHVAKLAEENANED